MLSHLDREDRPSMVDVSHKDSSLRTAHARSVVDLPSGLVDACEGGEILTGKGPVFQTAIIAGVMAAKRTHELIPFCHPVGLDDCRIGIELNEHGQAVIDCHATVTAKTGVEMEALTGASVAALTIYDMCKSVSHEIVISQTRLISKRGGKSDYDADSSV